MRNAARAGGSWAGWPCRALGLLYFIFLCCKCPNPAGHSNDSARKGHRTPRSWGFFFLLQTHFVPPGSGAAPWEQGGWICVTSGGKRGDGESERCWRALQSQGLSWHCRAHSPSCAEQGKCPRNCRGVSPLCSQASKLHSTGSPCLSSL